MTDAEQKKIFARNLNNYLAQSGKTQKEVADAIKVSPQTFNTWCQGIAIPRMGKIQILADYFKIGKSDLIENKTIDNDNAACKGVRIPVLGQVAAGIPIDAIENILDWEEIPASMAATGEYFGLKIKGDSMLPIIEDGDVVIVRHQSQVENGEIAIVLVNGDEATAKKIKHTDTGLMLIPNNPAFEPMFFSKEEIANKPVQIIGRVVELRRTF